MDEKIEFAEGFIDTGRYDKAIGLLSEILDAGENLKAHELRGFAFYCIHDYDSAIPDLKFVSERDSEADLTNYYLSQIYFIKADYEKSKEYIHKALEIDEQNPEYLGDYITIEQTLQNYSHSIELCDKILQETPESNFALNARGYANLKLGKIEEAIIDFSKSVQENPMDFIGLNNLGIAFLKKGDKETAFSNFQKSLTQNPRNPDAYSYIGFLNYLNGSHDKALQYINKAMEFDPANPDTLKHRALVYMARGENEKAKADLLNAKEFGLNIEIDELLNKLTV